MTAARTALGAADVDDARFAAIVADALRVERAEPLSCRVEEVPYDVPALTTAARHWVRGRTRHPGGEAGYGVFVKVLRSWRRHPAFASVPEEHRAAVEAMLDHRAEARVYASAVAAHLPPGVTVPRVHAIVEIDDESTALWLEDVPTTAVHHDTAGLARSARLFGRIAGRAALRPLATAAGTDPVRSVRGYAEGRVTHQLLPALHDPATWAHPLVAVTVDAALRRDLLAAADALAGVVDELESMPHTTAHGDASPHNLLTATDRPDPVLIDFGFWSLAPVGFDLGQLLIGEIQLGERPAAELPGNGPACLAGYVQGLRDEGCTVSTAVVRRAHALQMLVFTALSALPLEFLDADPTPQRLAVSRERAAVTRWILDLVQATGGLPGQAGTGPSGASGTAATSAASPSASRRSAGPPSPG